jgi:hypothetical protein
LLLVGLSFTRVRFSSSQKNQEVVVPLREDPNVPPEELEAERAAEQELIDNGASRPELPWFVCSR